VITPAISILSAVEGLSLLDPTFGDLVLPITLVLVVALFAGQRFGTGLIGGLFGPVMLLWFVSIAILGGNQVIANPGVLAAANPAYAIQFFLNDPVRAFFTLGTVVLAVTGAEALYADMGHFGRKPIARAWIWLALPALLLCYAGQSALVLADPSAIRSPFYLMAPPVLLIPLLLLATAATIIASQSIISGAFSVTQQAVQLGYLPRLGGGVSRVIIRYGFSEHPDIPLALGALADPLPPTASYFLSRQTLIATNRPGMIRWREKLFAAMVRNAESPMSFFKLPVNRVVELGRSGGDLGDLPARRIRDTANATTMRGRS
jgi:K+ transporter